MDVGGKVNMTITFLSNVSPNDMMRQSFPFSYMEVSAASLDGADHAVQIYTDVSGGKSSLFNLFFHAPQIGPLSQS